MNRSNLRGPVGALLVLILSALAANPSVAIEPGEALSDPALEARARRLSADLRCLVCQNQSIDDSNAPLAKDLRLLVRERLSAGESDTAVMGYIVARYGDFVLLKPPLNTKTLLLWLTPLLLLGGVAFTIRRSMRSPGSDEPVPGATALTAKEEKQLRDILDRPN
jgi:cytochrome c-type biogenesis protein CcmH